MIVRNYISKDNEQTMKLMEKLSKYVGVGFDPKKWKDSDKLRLFSPGLRRQTLVAEEEDKIIGMGMIEARLEPSGEMVGYLNNWIVDPEHQGRGVGRILAEKALEILEKIGVDKIRINVGMRDKDRIAKLVCPMGFDPVFITFEMETKKEK
ncbi:MAG: GNAT family N-acetyltransferase [Candidatus Jordarchaeum sp.]|uniref:GNAT family N-acetyltransferase n=1 Tax=Candidatus Jordarchaeum sp. TaxID=2823881 RepID=UPI00404AEAF8